MNITDECGRKLRIRAQEREASGAEYTGCSNLFGKLGDMCYADGETATAVTYWKLSDKMLVASIREYALACRIYERLTGKPLGPADSERNQQYENLGVLNV